jgi:hypothetical protein
MSTWISYLGKPLGRIKLSDVGTKFDYISEDISSLYALFQIPPDDEVEMEGRGKITGKELRKELEGVSGFYPTMEAWLLKNERSKTIDEYEAGHKSD